MFLNLTDIIDHFEDANHFYLVFKGRLIVTLMKGKFIQGQEKEYQEVSKKFLKKKHIGALLLFAVLLYTLISFSALCLRTLNRL